MRLFLAIFLPFIVFFTIKRPLAGITCPVLQITVIGWLPAALWAVYSLSQFNTDRKIRDFNNLRVGWLLFTVSSLFMVITIDIANPRFSFRTE